MVSDDSLDAILDVVRGIQTDLSIADTRAVSQRAIEPVPSSRDSPTVFVSWAHGHSTWTPKRIRAWEESIATLSSTLRQSFGIDADVDLFHLHEPVDWTRFGQRGIVNNQRVVVVLSKAWAERWDGTNPPTEGAGAAREADSLHGLFSRNQQEWQDKLVIVMLPGVSLEDLPPDLDRVARAELDPSDQDSYQDLLRILTGQPRYEKPPLGTIPELPPLDSERNLAALRAQLAEVRRNRRDAGRDKTPEGAMRVGQLTQQESAIRGFIETALQGDD
jgi:hypothetical protein